MLDLYHHGSSVCAAKVRWAMILKDLNFEAHYVDILKGEQFEPEYIKINPKAVVPSLIHDGKILNESTVIMEYLDLAFPEKQLTPKDPFEYVKTRYWTKILDEHLHRRTASQVPPKRAKHLGIRRQDTFIEDHVMVSGAVTVTTLVAISFLPSGSVPSKLTPN